jgi:electron transfer flavoprotein beta subunit
LLLSGAQSSDHAFASTGIAAAAMLDWPHAAVVTKLVYRTGAPVAGIQRELEGGLLHEMEIDLPAVLTIQVGINTPRYASLRALKQAAEKPLELLSLQDVGLSRAAVCEGGSQSRVRRMYVPKKNSAQMVAGSIEEKAAKLLHIIREVARGAM